MIRAPKFYERAREIANRVHAPAPKAKAGTANSGELYIYDDIGAGWFGDGITAKDVAAKLEEMGSVSDLSIYINSPGGSVSEGVAILSLLERFSARKTVFVDGIAASIASVIAMAGDRVVMHRAATFMIHDPWTISIGNSAALRKEADVLDKLSDSILAAYSKKTGTKSDEIRELMHAETWMTAEEAVAHGFADEIQAPEDREPEARASAPAPRALTTDELIATARARAANAKRLSGASPGPSGQPGTSATQHRKDKKS